MISLSFTHPNINIRVTALDALGDGATERDHVILRFTEQQRKKGIQVIQLSCEESKTKFKLKFPVKGQHILQNLTCAAF